MSKPKREIYSIRTTKFKKKFFDHKIKKIWIEKKKKKKINIQ